MSKITLVIGLLCVSLTVALGQDYVSGVLTYHRRMGGRAGEEQAPVTCAVGEDRKCKDCRTLLICDGQGKDLGPMDCGGKYPYCNGNSCSNQAPADCVPKTPDFRCTSDGYKPDPSTCLKYYYCSKGTVIKAYNCPSGYYVDTTLFKCKKVGSSKDCATISCSGITTPTHFVYPTNKSFYAYCATATSTPVMFSCGSGYQFNSEAKNCDYKCTGEGNFPGKTPSKFVFCWKEGGEYKYTENDCPADLKYDSTQRACV